MRAKLPQLGFTWAFFFLGASLPGCANEPTLPTAANSPWEFSQPTAVFQLPSTLAEISGLTVLDSTHLGAIQDEQGVLYVLNTANGAIEREVDFAGSGDYEGVEHVEGRLFVLRSDGTLLELTGWQGNSAEAQEVHEELPPQCDAEGLGYDEAIGRLLIACKSGPDQDDRYLRPVYAFGLASNQLEPSPVFVLDAAEIIRRPGYDSGINKTMRIFAGRFTDISGFTPSALAVDEQADRIYLLSSGRKALLELDRAGEIMNLWPLPEELFPQPEGIALARDGTLYLTNESPDGGTLLVFKPR